MGESREWALIANAKDPTLLKNRLTSWLGSSLGLSYTPQMVPVDVVMIGSECGRIDLGSYSLSEYVEIGPSRLAIDKLGKDVVSEQGDINLTGGYLLSIYNLQQNSDEPKGNRRETPKPPKGGQQIKERRKENGQNSKRTA